MFNYELGMFDAVIEGRKTETRRMKQTYKKGEKLFLKEPYLIVNSEHCPIRYKYDETDRIRLDNPKWKNKMFMKAIYARYFIEIVDVRKEPLQDITVESCLAEGIEKGESGYFDYIGGRVKGNNVYYPFSPKGSFRSLWEKINGFDSWNLNPEIVVYTLSLIHI